MSVFCDLYTNSSQLAVRRAGVSLLYKCVHYATADCLRKVVAVAADLPEKVTTLASVLFAPGQNDIEAQHALLSALRLLFDKDAEYWAEQLIRYGASDVLGRRAQDAAAEDQGGDLARLRGMEESRAMESTTMYKVGAYRFVYTECDEEEALGDHLFLWCDTFAVVVSHDSCEVLADDVVNDVSIVEADKPELHVNPAESPDEVDTLKDELTNLSPADRYSAFVDDALPLCRPNSIGDEDKSWNSLSAAGWRVYGTGEHICLERVRDCGSENCAVLRVRLRRWTVAAVCIEAVGVQGAVAATTRVVAAKLLPTCLRTTAGVGVLPKMAVDRAHVTQLLLQLWPRLRAATSRPRESVERLHSACKRALDIQSGDAAACLDDLRTLLELVADEGAVSIYELANCDAAASLAHLFKGIWVEREKRGPMNDVFLRAGSHAFAAAGSASKTTRARKLGLGVPLVVRLVRLLEAVADRPLAAFQYDAPGGSSFSLQLLQKKLRFTMHCDHPGAVKPEQKRQHIAADDKGASKGAADKENSSCVYDVSGVVVKAEPTATQQQLLALIEAIAMKPWYSVPRTQLEYVKQVTDLLPGKVLEFRYERDMDKNGILFWMGSNGATLSHWVNPASVGLTPATSSDGPRHLPYGQPSHVLGRDPNNISNCHTSDSKRAYIAFDLGVSVVPTAYTLRTSRGMDNSAMRTWHVLMSADGERWRRVWVHADDESLSPVAGATATWHRRLAADDCPTAAYRYVRIQQRGPNSSQLGHQMSLAGFEIYGYVVGAFTGDQFTKTVNDVLPSHIPADKVAGTPPHYGSGTPSYEDEPAQQQAVVPQQHIDVTGAVHTGGAAGRSSIGAHMVQLLRSQVRVGGAPGRQRPAAAARTPAARWVGSQSGRGVSSRPAVLVDWSVLQAAASASTSASWRVGDRVMKASHKRMLDLLNASEMRGPLPEAAASFKPDVGTVVSVTSEGVFVRWDGGELSTAAIAAESLCAPPANANAQRSAAAAHPTVTSSRLLHGRTRPPMWNRPTTVVCGNYPRMTSRGRGKRFGAGVLPPPMPAAGATDSTTGSDAQQKRSAGAAAQPPTTMGPNISYRSVSTTSLAEPRVREAAGSVSVASTNQAASAESLQRPTASLENLLARSRPVPSTGADLGPSTTALVHERIPETPADCTSASSRSTTPDGHDGSAQTLGSVPENESVSEVSLNENVGDMKQSTSSAVKRVVSSSGTGGGRSVAACTIEGGSQPALSVTQRAGQARTSAAAGTLLSDAARWPARQELSLADSSGDFSDFESTMAAAAEAVAAASATDGQRRVDGHITEEGIVEEVDPAAHSDLSMDVDKGEDVSLEMASSRAERASSTATADTESKAQGRISAASGATGSSGTSASLLSASEPNIGLAEVVSVVRGGSHPPSGPSASADCAVPLPPSLTQQSAAGNNAAPSFGLPLTDAQVHEMMSMLEDVDSSGTPAPGEQLDDVLSRLARSVNTLAGGTKPSTQPAAARDTSAAGSQQQQTQDRGAAESLRRRLALYSGALRSYLQSAVDGGAALMVGGELDDEQSYEEDSYDDELSELTGHRLPRPCGEDRVDWRELLLEEFMSGGGGKSSAPCLSALRRRGATPMPCEHSLKADYPALIPPFDPRPGSHNLPQTRELTLPEEHSVGSRPAGNPEPCSETSAGVHDAIKKALLADGRGCVVRSDLGAMHSTPVARNLQVYLTHQNAAPAPSVNSSASSDQGAGENLAMVQANADSVKAVRLRGDTPAERHATILSIVHGYQKSHMHSDFSVAKDKLKQVFDRTYTIRYSGQGIELISVTASSDDEPQKADTEWVSMLSVLDAKHYLKKLVEQPPPPSRESSADLIYELDVSQSYFVSGKLSQRLSQQLRDSLTVAANAMPAWIDKLLADYPWIFSYEARRDFFQATAFGPTRTVVWLQEQRDAALERQRGGGGGSSAASAAAAARTALAGARRDDHYVEYRLGRLQHELFKVPRADEAAFFAAACRVLEAHADSKSALEIQFDGEAGTGLGPTLEFYTLFAAAVQRKSVAMWLCDDTQPDDPFVRAAAGLFPAPFPQRATGQAAAQLAAACRYFSVLGIFIGKALMDNRLVDLPLSRPLLKLMCSKQFAALAYSPSSDGECELDGVLDLDDLTDIQPSTGNFLASLSSYERRRAAAVDKDAVQFECAGQCCSIDDLHLTFSVNPCSKVFCYGEHELVADGAHVSVGAARAGEYWRLVRRWHLGAGVRRQMRALAVGMRRVLALGKLAVFAPDELDTLLCGNRAPDWTEREVAQYTEPKNGYTRQATGFKNFVQAMALMDGDERRAFLMFATGCASLPPGGLSQLRPRLTVVRKDESTQAATDASHPSVNTCQHYLKLPDYSSVELMKRRLLEAATVKEFALN